jgi:hypothetical protein
MSEANNWNENVIADFRANGGQVGGPFAGAPMVLVHHHGRRTGQEYVNPMMYLATERGDGSIYGSPPGGGADEPGLVLNPTAADGAGRAGTGTFPVTVREIHGESTTGSTPSRPGAIPGSPSTRRDRRGADDPGAGLTPASAGTADGRRPGPAPQRPGRSGGLLARGWRSGGDRGGDQGGRRRPCRPRRPGRSSQVVAAIPS